MSKRFDVEAGFISKLLEIKDMTMVKDSQIKAKYFTGENKLAFRFIQETFSTTGEVPTERVFKRKFPTYPLEYHTVDGETVLGTDENFKYWCNELRVKVKHNTIVDLVEKAANGLKDFKTEEAYADIKKGIAYIESEVVETSAIDLTKTDSQDRINQYLERKKNKGMTGIPTGFKHLDFILKGLPNQTLTTVIAQTGVGKALTMNTPVLTERGYIYMRNIKVGDKVFASDGKCYPVTGVFPQGKKKLFRVSFEDGTYVDCCKDHLWCYKTSDDLYRKNDWRVNTLENIIKKHPIKRGRLLNLCIPVNKPIKFKGCDLPLDPYALGVLLGDGGFTTDRISLTTPDIELVSNLNNRLQSFNGYFKKCTSKNLQYLFKSYDRSCNDLFRCIKKLGLIGKKSIDKFIPAIYLKASVEDRLNLVRGLIDTDGSIDKKGAISFYTSSKRLCNDFVYLIHSLGYRCRVKKYSRNKNPEYKVFICAKTDNLFTTEYRKNQYNKATISGKNHYYDVLKITDIQEFSFDVEMQCISVDSPDHTFICGDFIVTHNTWFQIIVGARCVLENYRVLQLVTEMSENQMRDRFEAMLYSLCYGDLNYNKFKSGNLDPKTEKQYFKFLTEDLPNFEPIIIDTAVGAMSVAAIIDKYNPDIVFIDSAYLMEDDQGAKEDWLRVTHITRDLKKLAKRCNIPIVINTQADENTSKKTGPEIGSIKYTQSIGKDSDNIIAMYRDDIMKNDNEMGIKVLKQREGELGKCVVNWDLSSMDFSDIFMNTEKEENSGSDETLDIL